MEINQDKLTINISLGADDFNEALDKYKEKKALLNVEKDKAPELFMGGNIYPINRLTYSYVTKGESEPRNEIVATVYINDAMHDLIINNENGKRVWLN
ncbi:hypothetical protein [Pediococcus acidilactici]|uniref:hypothetical protein n=1 Tax=Pediococcus acidilactici TaxID=1254 RepID=UPI003B430290